jgi:hypothetical protein
MRQSKKSDPNRYTKPELRDHIKEEVVASDKGGDPGQWSARKAQLVAQEYEKEGGGYKKPRDATQKSLKQWGDEHWTTADGEQARRPGGTARYLPEKAWDKLSPEEKAATNEKKRQGSRAGKQFVGNTPKAAAARKSVSAGRKKAAAPTRKTAARKSPRTARKAAKRVSS